MDKALLEALYEQATAIAKETAGKLAQYHKSVSEILYAHNPVTTDTHAIPEGPEQEQIRAISEKLLRQQEQASTRVAFAPEDKMKQAAEMEQILKEGNEKIRRLYDEGLKAQQTAS